MNKIEKAYKIIKNRLPESYNIPKIKIYKTVYSMLKAQAKLQKISYSKIKTHYSQYYKKYNSTYIDSKYYPELKKCKWSSIAALSSNPIKINIQHTKRNTLNENVFLILHEIGHSYLHTRNERQCDLFAINWIRKFKKERLIK